MSTIMKALEKANREGNRVSDDGSWQQVLGNNSDIYAADILRRRRQMRRLTQIVVAMGLVACVSLALLAVLVLWMLNGADAGRLNALFSSASAATYEQDQAAGATDHGTPSGDAAPGAPSQRGIGDRQTSSAPGPQAFPRVLSSRLLDSAAFSEAPLPEWNLDSDIPEPVLGSSSGDLAPPDDWGRRDSPPPVDPPTPSPHVAPPPPPPQEEGEDEEEEGPVDQGPRLPRLAGIMWTEQNPFAFIDGNTVSVGETVSGYRVLEITRHTVMVESPEGRHHILRP